MKKFLAIALAATALTTGVASAAPGDRYNGGRDGRYERNDRDHDRGDRYGRYERDNDRWDQRVDKRQRYKAGKYYAPRGYKYRHWQRGERLPVSYRQRVYVIERPDHYHLRPAPYGYQWTRVGDDAVLTAVATGLIAAVAVSLFAN